jgi:hypothetical protein
LDEMGGSQKSREKRENAGPSRFPSKIGATPRSSGKRVSEKRKNIDYVSGRLLVNFYLDSLYRFSSV